MYDLIVIGAGPGGYEAAAHAAAMGKRVAVVEKARVGGTCLNVGCIPTKTFLKTSKLLAECRQGECYGLEIAGLTFNMPALIARKNRIVSTLTRGVESMLKRAGVETIAGHGRLASRDTVDIEGRRLETQNILIATGSRPATPKIPGLSEHALDSTGILDRADVPASIAIVGGGYIGLEFASFFAAAGSRVTVLEMLSRIGGVCDRDIAERLVRSLEKAGVVIRTSCRVASVSARTVAYDGGEIEADCILNATGRVPVIEGLGLDEIGVDFDARGIRASDDGRTSVPGVWACGDVTGRRLLAHAATREGIVAVNNMFGRRDRIRYHAVPAVIYTHPEVAGVGWTEDELKSQGVEYRRAMLPMSVAGRFLVENEGSAGTVKVLAGKRYGEILGVHAIGDGASEFIVMAAAMIEKEMCARDLEDVVFPHPTLGEALKSAVLQVM